jgi:hypothetical protein
LTDPLPEVRYNVDAIPDGVENESATFIPYYMISGRWTYQLEGWRRVLTKWTYPSKLRPTSVDMLSWMTNMSLVRSRLRIDEVSHLEMIDPLEAIFMVMYLDTMAFLDSFGKGLEDIMRAAANEGQLRKYIKTWIGTISLGQSELPVIKQSTQEFVRHAYPYRRNGEIRKFLEQVTDRLDLGIEQADKPYKFIRAEFSMLQTQKQLVESESVTRLTELAFIFIPLSFIASTFSMQIQELQDPPSATLFIHVGIATLVLAYGLRLFIRSSLLATLSETTTRAVTSSASIAPGQPIPTRAVLRFIIDYIVSKEAVILLLLAGTIWLWITRSQLDTAFKAVLTTITVIGVSTPFAIPKARNRVVSATLRGNLNFIAPPPLAARVQIPLANVRPLVSAGIPENNS